LKAAIVLGAGEELSDGFEIPSLIEEKAPSWIRGSTNATDRSTSSRLPFEPQVTATQRATHLNIAVPRTYSYGEDARFGKQVGLNSTKVIISATALPSKGHIRCTSRNTIKHLSPDPPSRPAMVGRRVSSTLQVDGVVPIARPSASRRASVLASEKHSFASFASSMICQTRS